MTNLRGPPNTTLLPEGRASRRLPIRASTSPSAMQKRPFLQSLTLRYGAYGKLWQRG